MTKDVWGDMEIIWHKNTKNQKWEAYSPLC